MSLPINFKLIIIEVSVFKILIFVLNSINNIITKPKQNGHQKFLR